MPLKKPRNLFMAAAMAMCVLAATVVWTLVFSTPASAEDDWRNLDNLNSGRCLAVPGSSTANGTGLIQWTCSDNADQDWTLVKVAGGNGDRYQIRNRHSLLCLAMPGASVANGTQAVQWPCGTGDEQVWIYDSWNRLRNLHSDRCLGIPGSSTDNGAEAVQWTCSDSFDQRWTWYDHEAVSARLYNMATGFCLADANADTANGAAMIQWSCSNSDSNYWTLQAVTGGYRVINKASGKCLTPATGTALGAKVLQQPCGDGGDQVWIHDSWDRLRNVQSDYCLAIPSSSPNTGTEAIQWTCTDNPNEQWLW
ncbi:RICIN domain-containing protein [Streptomyces sp. NPDC056738]|uniref:RICIN domain-containing protein n=1 Tax=Streptomyces sp. NPDC056738 TaxID=3345933 RepID=UPI00369CDA12